MSNNRTLKNNTNLTIDNLSEYIILKERYPDLDEKNLNEIVTAAIVGLGLTAIFAVIGAATFITDLANMMQDIFYKGSGQCSMKYAKETYYHNACVCKIRLDAYTKLAKELNSKKGKCSSEEDPMVCQNNIELALRKLKVKEKQEKIMLRKAEQEIKKYAFKY